MPSPSFLERCCWSRPFFHGSLVRAAERNLPPDPLATRLRLNGSFPDLEGVRNYNVQGVPGGFGIMFGAGALSGLLGIGSGAMKVLAMDQAMKIPFKVSTTTSNFMIGVTAAASAGIYLDRGYIDPGLSMPVMLGVLAGSLVGSRILVKTQTKWLRLVFSAVIVLLGIEMLYKGLVREDLTWSSSSSGPTSGLKTPWEICCAPAWFFPPPLFSSAPSFTSRGHGHEPANYRVFQGEPSELRSVSGVVRDALELSGRGIIQLGLLFLIATPVARVIFSIWGFAAERDRMYVVVHPDRAGHPHF